ncbi:hypothetical protein FRC00_001927 [Tulasnella sp. 408]|nr:hypothetical protein FRC00_001927 [Tulasnella sp. 408]
MFHDLFEWFNLNQWRRESRRIGLVLLQYCDKLQEGLGEDGDLPLEIKGAIDEALNALNHVNRGHEYDSENQDDPLIKAENRFKSLFPEEEWIQPSEDRFPKQKLVAAAKMIRGSILFRGKKFFHQAIET